MQWSLPAAPTLAALLTACVTVNVYFPAAAAQQAADQIIDKVTGQTGAPGTSAPAPAPGSAPRSGSGSGEAAPGAAAPPRPQASLGAPREPAALRSSASSVAAHAAAAGLPARGEEWMRASLALVLDHLIPAAHAQGSPNLDISTPQIRAITDSMQRRFPQLEPFFASGAIGMTADGMVAVRDVNAVPLAQRALVTRLVADDNRDRTALYAEIARANGHPEWEPDIRRTFARRWVARGAQPGWYYQDAGGSWKRK